MRIPKHINFYWLPRENWKFGHKGCVTKYTDWHWVYCYFFSAFIEFDVEG